MARFCPQNGNKADCAVVRATDGGQNAISSSALEREKQLQ